MKNQSFLNVALASSFVALLATAPIGAQAPLPSILGAWRADAPLPNGVVQTFRFDPDGNFDLAITVTVDGSYRTDGNKLIETVTLPYVGATRTDTATFTIGGDSLIVNESAVASPRVLHRSGTQLVPSSIVGDWVILIGKEMDAHYVFDRDGTMHVRALVGDEQGKYLVRADTLHLSNNQTFQLPATAQFAIADSVLTLTPPNGKQARHFHKVAPR